MLIAYDEQHGIRRADNVVASVTLSENGWYHITSDISFTHKKTKKKPQESVTRRQFMAVLHVLDRVLIQSKFNTDQIVGK